MITEVAIEVIQEISAGLVIIGVLVVTCLWTTNKPENDIEWKDIDGAK